MSLRSAATGPDGLVVIEASGKLGAFRRAIEHVGWNFGVVATLGHLYEWPTSLRHPGVCRRSDGGLVDHGRRAARPEVLAHVTQRLSGLRPNSTVILATDNDDEGHAIAADVAALVREHCVGARLQRALPGAITLGAIASALSRAQVYEPGAETLGVARRQVDRVIGAGWSDLEGRKPVGRVLSALLRSVDRLPVSTERKQHVIHDGRIDIVVECPGRGVELSSGDLRLGGHGRVAAEAPPNYFDAIGILEDDAGIDIASAAALLQELYISGKIGYPRTTRRGFDPAAAATAEVEARRLGLARFGDISSEPAVDQYRDDAHPAIALTEDGWASADVLRPLASRSTPRERVLAALARRSIASVLTVEAPGIEVLRPDLRIRGARIAGLPWMARHVPATRDVSVGRALVDRMEDEGIGRPSTVVAHAAKAQRMGWVSSSGALSPEGRAVLAAAPAGLDAAASRAVEDVLRGAAQSGAPIAAARAIEWLQDCFPSRADALEAVLEPAAQLDLPDLSMTEDLEHDDAPSLRL